jgi:hypothetical protein
MNGLRRGDVETINDGPHRGIGPYEEPDLPGFDPPRNAPPLARWFPNGFL